MANERRDKIDSILKQIEGKVGTMRAYFNALDPTTDPSMAMFDMFKETKWYVERGRAMCAYYILKGRG